MRAESSRDRINMRHAAAIALIALGLTTAGCSTGGMFSDRDQLVAAPSACSPQRFEIYFADGQAGLTNPAQQAISLTATQLHGCDVRAVKVLGLADARGGAQANLNLSEQRAVTVAAALVAAGLPAPAFDIAAAGDQGATTGDGLREPLRRRTEVVIDAAPRN